MRRHRGCSTVTVTDGKSDTVLIGVRPGPDFLAPDRVMMAATATVSRPHPPLTRALYAPALTAWCQWWRRSASATSSASVPWSQTLELTGPDLEPHRIRIEDITQIRLA